jgi:hypothetical protein
VATKVRGCGDDGKSDKSSAWAEGLLSHLRILPKLDSRIQLSTTVYLTTYNNNAMVRCNRNPPPWWCGQPAHRATERASPRVLRPQTRSHAAYTAGRGAATRTSVGCATLCLDGDQRASRVRVSGPRARTEQHFADSLVTVPIAVAIDVMRWLPQCPFCRRTIDSCSTSSAERHGIPPPSSTTDARAEPSQQC